MSPILSLNSITKSFASKKIIDHLSLDIQAGEFVSILGPSGSGKSTLFHLIGGIYNPDEGEILLDGSQINGQRGSISYMPQSPSLLPWRTVLQNVLLGQELQGKKDVETARKMIEKAGLAGYTNAYPSQLSGGMKQRVSFIRALLSPQPVICLDEPFSALDELTRLDMQKWLLSIWDEHKKTILFVTHNIDEALFMSDRIVIISANPASITEEFILPFSRPRHKELLLTDEFLAWKRKIFFALRK
ncbi:ABC transporter ATP-binding protein [Niallia endozanthoxylica]|uniref:ABC transporter ATP-binding protein n=1 Tax=Niallia endozanthoxylica TaxID=2036016 RepID=A0A5J5HM75_9BACI|nr:ABC transporter ATP-binding protein [Niallia endozanthoxylica]KAA9021660.1 ABC transporter ATP-binding protein [Niallia endozanthoxylica]